MFREFIQRFIKPEHIRESGKNLLMLDITDHQKQLKPDHIDVGKCQTILSSLSKKSVFTFKDFWLLIYQDCSICKKIASWKFSSKNPLPFRPNCFWAISNSHSPEEIAILFPHHWCPWFQYRDHEHAVWYGHHQCSSTWWDSIFKLKKYPSVERIVTACQYFLDLVWNRPFPSWTTSPPKQHPSISKLMRPYFV